MIHFVLHDPKDSVAVVVVEGVKSGQELTGWIMDEDRTISIKAQQDVPIVQWASELQRTERPMSDLWVSCKCGESDITSGCGSNPTVGNAFDKLEPPGVTMCFGETTEITGGEQIVAARCATPQVAEHASVRTVKLSLRGTCTGLIITSVIFIRYSPV